MISITQMRAARALLNLSQSSVSKELGIATNTLSKIESGQADPAASRIDFIQTFYESRGVEFTSGDGVRKRQAQIIEYKGADGFRAFMDDVYATVKETGGSVCVHDVAPENWIKWLGREWNEFHTARMTQIERKFDFKITIKQGDHNFIGKHVEYRWLPERSWNDQSFYAYGDKLALLLFQPEDVNIRVVHSRQFADGFRALFTLAWEHIPPIPEAERTP